MTDAYFKIINNNFFFLINIIYYLTKCHLHNIFFKKKKKILTIHAKTWFYTWKMKNTCKTIFIGGFIFKEYEDNRRDQMHWMGSYETSLLIISNYNHHLLEKNINTSYYLHFKKFILTSKFIVGCEMLWYCNKQRWYNDKLVLHARFFTILLLNPIQ